jgi:5'-nucleotidase
MPGLRAQGYEMIITLTHIRESNDLTLAEKTTEGLIDLILGCHDHYYNHEIRNKTHVLRSRTDFRQLSCVEARRKPEKGWDFNITRRDIERAIPENPDTTCLAVRLCNNAPRTNL